MSSENEQCKSVVCCVSKYDLNINWTDNVKCLSWVHCLSRGSFSQKILLFQMMPTFNVCVVGHVILRNPLGITLLPSQMKIVNATAQTNIGDYEQELLETLDRIKVVHQAYHGDVFIGNHCKIILNNYEKLCDVVFDEPELHEDISECFRILSELDKLISAKQFLIERE